MKYIALIEPGDRDNPDFGVVIPDLHGCYAQGDSFEGALRDAREAAEDWVKAMLECGEPLPAASSLADLRSEHPEWRD